MSLVSTDWVEKNIYNVKIIDCSWHMPNMKRDGYKEYLQEHIENAIFFDLDKNSDQKTDLPHMLTNYKEWEEIVSKMGIANDDEIVIYDNSDVLSSCRCWYNFIYFGHNNKLVHVLDGGLKKWTSEGKSTTKEILNIFKNTLGEKITSNIVFSCGSGVTASVLALAYSLINNKYMPTIYDGSWAEYGKN